MRRVIGASPVYFWMALVSHFTLFIITARRLKYVSYLCLSYLVHLTLFCHYRRAGLLALRTAVKGIMQPFL
jgi:hypothetical protein